MAIKKCRYKVSRWNPDYQVVAQMRDTVMCSDDENLQRGNSISAVQSDDDEDDQFDECDSGAGSDDFDLLELGQTGEEFCQVGDQTCSIPYELYDLPGFNDILSIEVWNEVLTEDERYGLAKYLPDMDQENFILTLKELFSCDNLHFGSPVDNLFDMMKEGSCEPRVAHYRQGMNFLQRRLHYHNIRKHQNAMVNNLCQMRDAWMNCKGYSIEEKLRVLNIKKCQKSLMNENMENFGTDSSEKDDSGNDLWSEKARDAKLVPKAGRYSGYSRALELDICTPALKVVTESNKLAKQNAKGTLKLAGSKITSSKELADHSMPIHPKAKVQSRRYGLALPVYRNKPVAAAYNTSDSLRKNKSVIEDDDEEETTFGVALHRERNLPRGGANAKSVAFNGKKQKRSAAGSDGDSSLGLLETARSDISALGRNKAINQFSDIKVTKPSNRRDIYDGGTKMNFPKNFQQFSPETEMEFGNNQKLSSSFKANQSGLLGGSEQSWIGKPLRGPFPDDSSYDHAAHLNAKSKKGTTGRKVFDLNANDMLLQSVNRAKILQEKFRINSKPNGQRDATENIDVRALDRGEETESDSSDQMVDDDENPLMRSKWAYPGGVSDLKYGPETKKVKLSRKDAKDGYLRPDGSLKSTKQMDFYGEDLDMIRPAHKGKMHDVSYLNVLPTDDSQENCFIGPGNVIGGDDPQLFYQLGRNGHVEGSHGNCFNTPSLKSSFVPGRRPISVSQCNIDHPQSDYMNDYSLEDDLFWTRPIAADNGVSFKLGKKGQMVEPSTGHHHEISGAHLMGCNSISKKRRLKDGSTSMYLKDNKDCLHDDAQLLLDGINSLRKHGKKNKLEEVSDVLEDEISEPPSVEVEMDVVEAQTKPKNKPFPLITPTVLTGFSFSIIHLLSSVRRAMITTLPEDFSQGRKHDDKDDAGERVNEEQARKQEDTSAINSASGVCNEAIPNSTEQNVLPRTVQEIVSLVRSNPGDPCILETQEPLQDLVRGVLKIFSSRTAPLGAKGWKPLVVYEKSAKSWSWIGPVVHNFSDTGVIEEETSPDAWALPYKTLVKLVDSFANWLKNSQDALQQIGSLPAPPLSLMQNIFDEKERFKDLRAQKSLSTISPNPEEVRGYFRKEEVLRYLIPDRAFSYTAVDGKKSIVAPLRRCGGKPTSKARDHFMLKRDRPPHVTILCLVRDAAARLPGSIGTRADVCTLIRDSQYIVEDVSDAQVNQVVSGALDRLHYERDPCVQFDGERKLWVYLHRERDEEDFEDDGTSSTKKWRKQKKEPSEPSDQGGVTVAFSGPTNQSGFDMVSDLNVEAFADDNKKLEIECHSGNDQVKGNHDPTPVTWKGLGLNSMGQNELTCQENSANGDFEDTFGE